MRRTAVSAVLMLTSAAVASADVPASAGIAIVPGQQIVLRIADTVSVASVARVEPTPVDMVSAREQMAIPTPAGPVAEGTPVYRRPGEAPPHPQPGQVALRMFVVDGRATILVVENGYHQALVYRARELRGGRSQPTDVCIVIPAKSGYEHWPYRIDRLDLSDFRFVAWKAGDQVPCA